ncbi:hypothetical protein Q5752_005938 [Cryptotrichosporon argae]
MLNLALPLTLPLPLLLLLVLLYLARRPLLALITPRGVPGIPAYPDPLPVLGDVVRFGKLTKALGTAGAAFDAFADDLGPLYQLRIGFFNTFIILNDADEIESLLVRRHATLDRSPTTMGPFAHVIPTGMLSLPTGPQWKHHRRIIGPAMTTRHLALTAPRANDAVGKLVELWRAKMAKAQVWEAEKDLEGATLDAITGISFGKSWDTSGSAQAQVEARAEWPVGAHGVTDFTVARPPLVDSIMDVVNSVPISSPFPRLSTFVTTRLPAYRRSWARLRDALTAQIVRARARAADLGAHEAAETADNTLDLMVARELRGDDWMPEDEMRDELLTYVMAGTETTETTLAWWVKYMTNNPAVQVKLRAHLQATMPFLDTRPPALDDVVPDKTPYLEAVVQEALRLSRTAAGVIRRASELTTVSHDTVVLGKVLPKGVDLFLPNRMNHEDASTPVSAEPSAALFPRAHTDKAPDPSPDATLTAGAGPNFDSGIRHARLLDAHRADGPRKSPFWAAGTAKTFDPDRWIVEGRFEANVGPSLPFSAGQRGCFGKTLALLEMRLFVAQLAHAFFFAPVPEPLNGNDMYQTITAHAKHCYVRCVAWDSDEARAALAAFGD